MSAASPAAPSVSTVNAVKEKARRLSILSILSTTAAGSGHPTSCMSAAELVAGAFFYAMKFNPRNPNSADSDRFVLSKGHAAPLLYAAFAEAGVFPESRVMTLRQFSSELEGHPTPRIPGVDAATGSLGQGLSVGAGLAIGARLDASGSRVYVLMGDGEMAEGQVWEAAAFAGHYKLDNLTVLADVNALGQSEATMYQHDMETYRRKFESEGWATEVIDGHDVAAVLAALDRAKATKDRPQAIIARTVKGHGVSFLAGKLNWHGKPVPKDQLAAALQEIGGAPLEIPADPGKSYERTSLPQPPDFPAPAALDYDPAKPVATREAYGQALKRLGAVNPEIVAISGDVKNSTFSEVFGDAFPDHFFQGYIAEQNLVSAGVGLAARGKVPFVDSFACFLTRAYDQRAHGGRSAAATSICAARTAASRSAKTGRRRWRSRTWPCSAQSTARPSSIPATPFPPSASPKPWRGAAASTTCARRGRRRRFSTPTTRYVSRARIQGAAPERAGPRHRDRRGHHAARSAQGRGGIEGRRAPPFA